MADGSTDVSMMWPRWPGVLALIALLLSVATTAHAQSFSADLTIVPKPGAVGMPAGKLRVSGSKVRLETPDLADGFFLIDGEAPSAYFVRPAARTFMDARQSSRLTQWFVAVDPQDPCRRWRAMAMLAGTAEQGDWRCERAGEQQVAGHGTIVWRAVMSSGREITGWIDETRKFPLRIKADDGTIITADNIRDEPQPARLFEIAAGTRKFDPRVLIERIKQSDVWVAGQKDATSSAH